MKVTTANPVKAPITSASTRNTWSSRCCSLAVRDKSGVLHQLPLVLSTLSLISPADISQKHNALAEQRKLSQCPILWAEYTVGLTDLFTTRLLVSQECFTHPTYLSKMRNRDTMVACL